MNGPENRLAPPLSARVDGVPLLATLLLTGLGYRLRFGYRFGYSDQDEFLPWLLSRLQPDLLGADWFVQSQIQAFSVRTGFVTLLDPLARGLGVESAVLVLYVASTGLLVAGTYCLVRLLGGSGTSALGACLLGLVLLPRWTLGGNAAMSTMLVPSLTAWGLGLWVLVFLLARRPFLSALMVGAAAWIQILVAAQIGAVALVALVYRDRGLRPESARFALTALGLALPVVALLWQGGAGMPADSFAVLAGVRAPHHYDPAAFPVRDYFQFGLLAAGGILAWRSAGSPSAGSSPGHLAAGSPSTASFRLVTGLLWASGIGIGLGILGWILGSAFLLSLQPFSVSVVASLIFSVGLALRVPPLRLPQRSWVAVSGLVGLGWVAVLSGVQIAGHPPRDSALNDLNEVTRWARETPPDTRFAVPPSLSGFRYAAGRPIVVNFKAYPFSAGGPGEWYRRMDAWSPDVLPDLTDLAPIGLTAYMRGADGSRRGTDLLAPLDSAFEAGAAETLAALVSAYDVDLLLRRTPLVDRDSLFVRLPLPGPYWLYEPAAPPSSENNR